MFPTLSNCFPFEFIALLPTIESDDLSEFSILRFPIHSAVEPSEQIIRLAGKKLEDVPIQYIGLRPGEKLYEELLIGDNPKPTQHSRIMKAHETFLTWPQLDDQLTALSLAISVNDVLIIRGTLKQLVSDYQPSGEVVDWVYLAQKNQGMADH